MPIQTYRPSISKTPNYGNLISDWPVNEGLVSRWLTLPLLKGRPKFTDIAGGYNGTFTGYGSNSPWKGAVGRPGGFGSVLLDGTSSQTIATDYPGLQVPVTLEAWVYTSNLTSANTIFGSTATDSWLQFRIETSGALRFVKANVADIGSGTAGVVAAGQWVHVVGTLDASGNYAFYANGIPAGSGTNLQTITPQTLVFGINLASEVFIGVIDGMSIFNRVLSASDIYALYQDSRRGYPNSLNWLSRTTYFTGTGGTPTYTATIAGTAGPATASVAVTFTKPTYTATISGTAGAATASVTVAFTKPTYTATVAGTAAPAAAAVVATFAKPTYTATVVATVGAATATVVAMTSTTRTATIVALAGPATAVVVVDVTNPTYTATIVATAGPATASVSATFSTSVFIAAAFVLDQLSFIDTVDTLGFSDSVDRLRF